MANVNSNVHNTLPRMGRIPTGSSESAAVKPTSAVRNGDHQQHTQYNSNHQRSRPVSLYDNLRGVTTGSGSLHGSNSGAAAVSVGNLTTSAMSSSGHHHRNGTMDRSPSQAHFVSTTVPQNMAAIPIAGRHAPTRNSLRHSRMIVLSRKRKVSRKYHPPVMRHHKLGTALVAFQVLIGIAISTLAVWFLLWSPNLRIRDMPYWSGVPLLLSGIFGLLLLCCCRKEYPGMPLGFCVFAVKVFSVLLAVMAGVACFCACVFAMLHLIFLSQMTCEPASVINPTCVCRTSVTNATNNNGTATTAYQRVYHYTDLNCAEVGILSVLLIGSCAANAIGGILATWYVFLHWSSRYSYLYSEVKSNDNKPIVISNKMETKISTK